MCLTYLNGKYKNKKTLKVPKKPSFLDDKNIFIKGVENILSRIYTKSNWYPNGKHFDLNSYFTDQNMNVTEFITEY